MKLNNLILVLLIFAGVTIAIFAGLFFYYASITNLEDQVSHNMLAIAQARAGHITTYVEDNIEELNLVLTRTQLLEDIKNYNLNSNEKEKQLIIKKLNDSKNALDEIDHIDFIGMDGIVKASSNLGAIGENVTNKYFFIYGKEKSHPYLIYENGETKLFFSGPFVLDGKTMGVGLISIEIDEFREIVSARQSLGNTGESLIAYIDSAGNYVYPFKRLFEKGNEYQSNTGEPMKQALFGNSEIFKNSLDYRNVSVIAASQYIPILDLGLVVKIDSSEIIGSYSPFFFKSFIFILIVILFISIILGYILTRKISSPVEEILGVTRQIANKNFNARVSLSDIDELRELDNSFNKTAAVLENLEAERNHVDKAKTEFLSITSHELRSPMTPMKAQLQMVLGNYFGKLNKEQKDSLNIVLNNTERLDKIIVDFLEISRIEAARLKFNFIRADLNKMVYSVVEEMKGFMPEKKIKIIANVGRLPIIEVDPDRVSQVLRNLVNNAIKFTPENGLIEISTKVDNGRILFSIKDNGVGIPAQAQKRLFEPFYQVENMYQHKSGGTGLGLAISRGIVESQNGKIWLNSQPGKGTIFYFTIPLKPVRDVRAIKLLFSETAKSEELLKLAFIEYLGPLGNNEFENLRNTHGATFESINGYMSYIVKQGILKPEAAEEFKNKVAVILNIEEKDLGIDRKIVPVGLNEFKRAGLIP